MNKYFEEKNIGLCILLSIVTCGIYAIYWYYSILSDIYELANMPNSAGADVLLTIITCGLYGYYIWYKVGDIVGQIRENAGLYYNNNSILYIVLSFFGLQIITYAIVQNDLNDVIGRIKSNSSDTTM